MSKLIYNITWFSALYAATAGAALIVAYSAAVVLPDLFERVSIILLSDLQDLLQQPLTARQVEALRFAIDAIIDYNNMRAEFLFALSNIGASFYSAQASSCSLDILYPGEIFQFLPYLCRLLFYLMKIFLVTYLPAADIAYLGIIVPVVLPVEAFPAFIIAPPPSPAVYLEALAAFYDAFPLFRFISVRPRNSYPFFDNPTFQTLSIQLAMTMSALTAKAIAGAAPTPFVGGGNEWAIVLFILSLSLFSAAVLGVFASKDWPLWTPPGLFYFFIPPRDHVLPPFFGSPSDKEIAEIPVKFIGSLEEFITQNSSLEVLEADYALSDPNPVFTRFVPLEDCLPIHTVEQARALQDALAAGTVFPPTPPPTTIGFLEWRAGLDTVVEETLQLQASAGYFEMNYTIEMLVSLPEFFLRLLVTIITGGGF